MRLRMIPFIVSLSMFMEAVDSTIINTAIPVMSHSLQVSPIDLKIALISYLLSLAIFIPISGWLADRYGVKRVFILGLFVFTTSSFFCGMAYSLPALVVSRIFQGLGGSIMLPLGRLIVVRSYQKHELLNVMNQVVMVGALGMMLGPTLGGIITHYFTWRWIFLVNIPVGLISIIMAQFWLPVMKSQPVHPLDKMGFILFGSGLAVLTFGLSALSESSFQRLNIAIIILSAFILLALYFLHSRKQAYPIVNTKLFQFRTFRISVLGNLLSRLSFGALPFLTPLLFQIGFGYSPQLSGLLLAPTAMGVLVAKPLSLHMLRLFGYKRFLIANTICIGLAQCVFILVDQQTSLFVITLFTFLFGYLTAQQYTGMNSIAYSSINHTYFSSATSVMSTLQQLSQSFGVAVGAILLQYFARNSFSTSVVTIQTLHHTFLAMGIFTMATVFIFFKLKPDDGLELLKENG